MYLSVELTDRLRVKAIKDKGKLLKFVVQYESLFSGDWKPIIRYDNAHGFAHKDIIKPDGNIIKQPLFFQTYNLAFTYAIIDLKTNWKQYRENFENEIKK